VGIGLAVGFFYILKANAEQAFYSSDTSDEQPDTMHLRLSEHVTFLNKASIVNTLERLPAGTRVILDGTQSTDIDNDVLEAIESFRLVAEERNINLELRGIRQVEVVGH
jgi:MFS superfamily sulfate permease-like transporter